MSPAPGWSAGHSFWTRAFLSDDRTSNSEADPTRKEKVFFWVFIVLQLVGLAGALILLLTTLVSRRMKRSPVWVNFMVSWVISCTSYSLLVGNPLGTTPKRSLCVVQAIMIYTVPTLTACTTLALVVQVAFTVRHVMETNTMRNNLQTACLLLLPYLPAGGMAAVSTVTYLKDPNGVRRTSSGMYCNLEQELPSKLSAILVASIVLGCLSVQVLVVFDLRKNWTSLKGNVASVSMTLRVLAFSFLGLIAIIISMTFFFTTKRSPILNIVIAVVPVAAVLTFGTQSDVLRVWAAPFYKLFGRSPPPRSSISGLATSGERSGGTDEAYDLRVPHRPAYDSMTSFEFVYHSNYTGPKAI